MKFSITSRSSPRAFGSAPSADPTPRLLLPAQTDKRAAKVEYLRPVRRFRRGRSARHPAPKRRPICFRRTTKPTKWPPRPAKTGPFVRLGGKNFGIRSHKNAVYSGVENLSSTPCDDPQPCTPELPSPTGCRRLDSHPQPAHNTAPGVTCASTRLSTTCTAPNTVSYISL